jgi:hypothetical protein
MNKVNLLLEGIHVLADHLNIDPFAQDGDGKIGGDITNLDHTIDDGELEEIVADSVLEYFPPNIIGAIVDNWVKKLQKGGKLTVISPDIYEIARGIMRHEISEDKANELLFGMQEKDWQLKKNAFSTAKIEQLLAAFGMKITSKRFSGHKVMITAEKV